MSKMIQIRNVPEEIHKKLKVRATLAGKSLSDFLLEEVKHSLEKPKIEDLLERLHQRQKVNPKTSSAKMVRMERDQK
jgi:plasmid stability protein